MNELKFLELIFDSNLNWKSHLTGVANKVSRTIESLHNYYFNGGCITARTLCILC